MQSAANMQPVGGPAIKSESQVVPGYYLREPDFATIMDVKDLPEKDQILLLLSRCLRSGYDNPLFQTPEEVNNSLKPKVIVELFQELASIMEAELDYSDPLPEPGSIMQKRGILA